MFTFLKRVFSAENIAGDVRNVVVTLMTLGGISILSGLLGALVKAFQKEPIQWGLFGVLVLLGIVLFVIAILKLVKTETSKQPSGPKDVEQKVWQWISPLSPTILTNDKLHFGFAVQFPPHTRVEIKRPKTNASFIELRNTIHATDKQQARFAEMSDQDRQSALRAIGLEFNRSKIGPPHLGKKLEFVCLHKDIPIDADLNGARLLDGINDLKFAHSVIHPTLNNLLSEGIAKNHQRSPEVASVVKESVRILREQPALNNFPLQALQMAGLGNLKTEDEFAEVRERIIQYGFTDPIVGLTDIHGPETKWLQAIKWANRNQVSLTTPYVLIDCLRHSNQEISKQPPS